MWKLATALLAGLVAAVPLVPRPAATQTGPIKIGMICASTTTAIRS